GLRVVLAREEVDELGDLVGRAERGAGDGPMRGRISHNDRAIRLREHAEHVLVGAIVTDEDRGPGAELRLERRTEEDEGASLVPVDVRPDLDDLLSVGQP